MSIISTHLKKEKEKEFDVFDVIVSL